MLSALLLVFSNTGCRSSFLSMQSKTYLLDSKLSIIGLSENTRKEVGKDDYITLALEGVSLGDYFNQGIIAALGPDSIAMVARVENEQGKRYHRLLHFQNGPEDESWKERDPTNLYFGVARWLKVTIFLLELENQSFEEFWASRNSTFNGLERLPGARKMGEFQYCPSRNASPNSKLVWEQESLAIYGYGDLLCSQEISVQDGQHSSIADLSKSVYAIFKVARVGEMSKLTEYEKVNFKQLEEQRYRAIFDLSAIESEPIVDSRSPDLPQTELSNDRYEKSRRTLMVHENVAKFLTTSPLALFDVYGQVDMTPLRHLVVVIEGWIRDEWIEIGTGIFYRDHILTAAHVVARDDFWTEGGFSPGQIRVSLIIKDDQQKYILKLHENGIEAKFSWKDDIALIPVSSRERLLPKMRDAGKEIGYLLSDKPTADPILGFYWSTDNHRFYKSNPAIIHLPEKLLVKDNFEDLRDISFHWLRREIAIYLERPGPQRPGRRIYNRRSNERRLRTLLRSRYRRLKSDDSNYRYFHHWNEQRGLFNKRLRNSNLETLEGSYLRCFGTGLIMQEGCSGAPIFDRAQGYAKLRLVGIHSGRTAPIKNIKDIDLERYRKEIPFYRVDRLLGP